MTISASDDYVSHVHDACHARVCRDNNALLVNNRPWVPGCNGDDKMTVPDGKPQPVAHDSTQVAD
jgi:hypothetical protein